MLITSLNFGGSEVFLKIETFTTIESVNVKREFLLSSLCEFFSCFLNGYLRRGLECWSLFKCDKAFFLFDPLGIEVREKKMLRHRAVLYQFETIGAVVDQLMKCFHEEDSEESCEIGSVLTCGLCNDATIDCIVEETMTKPKKPKLKPSNHNVFILKDLVPDCETTCQPTCEETQEMEFVCLPIDDPFAN